MVFRITPKETLHEPEMTSKANPDTVINNSEVVEEEVLPVSSFTSNNIVFLIDVSISMKNNDKLQLLKASIKNLMAALRKIDKVTVISYSNDTKVHFVSIPGNRKEKMIETIDKLSPNGMTNGVQGLNHAYSYAKKNFVEGGFFI